MDEKTLKEILRLHQLWLEGDDKGKRADLNGADLRGAYLNGTDLRGAYLQGACLRGAYLNGADLRGADVLPDLYILKMQSKTTNLRAWKYLNNGKSPYQNAEYKVGKVYAEKDFSTDERMLCGKGLNIATLQWCLKDSGKDAEFIEVEFYVEDIIAIPFATDGKFRVKRFKVLRRISRKKAEKIVQKFMESYIKKDK